MKNLRRKILYYLPILSILEILQCLAFAFANVKVFPETLKNLNSVLFADNGLPGIEISFEEISVKPKKVGFISCNFAKETILKNLKFKIYADNPASENLNEIKSRYFTSLVQIEGFVVDWGGKFSNGKLCAQKASFMEGEGLNFRLKNASLSRDGMDYKFKDAVLTMDTSNVVLNFGDECMTLIKK